MDNNEVKTVPAETPENPVTPKDAPAAAEVKKAKLPPLLTVAPSPHIRGPENISFIMLDVLISLIPAMLWGVYVFGLRALAVVAISVIAAVAWEAIAQVTLKKTVTIRDLSAAVTGLLLAMNLPVTVPLWVPIVGSFIAIVVVKQLFGGIGKNFVNPALAARVFLFISFASSMSQFPAAGTRINSVAMTLGEGDIVVGATPLAALKEGNLPDVNLFDLITGSNMGGCIGEVSSLLLAAGGIYLLIRRVITWHIPLAYLGTVAALTFLFPQYGGVAADFMLTELFSGGLILGAFFMATDYATTPVTTNGRLIFGVGCGLITVLIRYFGSYPEGVSFAILIMNLLVWYIDKLTVPKRFGGTPNGKK